MSSPSPLRAIGPAEWAALIALSIIWGGSYLFMKIAVVELPVLMIVLSRVALGAFTLGGATSVRYRIGRTLNGSLPPLGDPEFVLGGYNMT